MLPSRTELAPCSGVVAFFSAVLFFFIISPLSAQSTLPASRFCATCGFHGVESFTSQSGQFVVHSSPVPLRRPSEPTNNPAIIELEPQLLVVTAERAKRAFCRELRIADDFRDKIHISVLDRAPASQPVTVVSQLHSDGFLYKVGVPMRVNGVQFAKALMQVVLLEYANRGIARCAELPPWLVEGMTRQAINAIQPAYVLNRRPVTIERTGYDRLGMTRAFLQTNAPLSIHELSFPKQGTADDRGRFEASSHLLVHRLLSVPDGPALMARFVQMLPRTMNWQTALFAAFGRHFDGPLAFEKWWMMNWLEFRKRELPQHWSVQSAVERLDALLLTVMEVRAGTNSIPTHRNATLQEVLGSTDFAAQQELLGEKLQQLVFLAVNVPEEVLPFWTAYQRTLDTYLQKRHLLQYQPALRSEPEQRIQVLVKGAINALDELDFARSELKAGRSAVLPGGASVQARR